MRNGRKWSFLGPKNAPFCSKNANLPHCTYFTRLPCSLLQNVHWQESITLEMCGGSYCALSAIIRRHCSQVLVLIAYGTHRREPLFCGVFPSIWFRPPNNLQQGKCDDDKSSLFYPPPPHLYIPLPPASRGDRILTVSLQTPVPEDAMLWGYLWNHASAIFDFGVQPISQVARSREGQFLKQWIGRYEVIWLDFWSNQAPPETFSVSNCGHI